MTFKEKKEKVVKFLARHCVEATALTTACNPIYAFFETIISRIPNEISIHSKYTGSLLSYIGLSKLYVEGGKLWDRKFGIDENTPLEKRIRHNKLYTAAFNAGFSVLFYPCNGEHDPLKVAAATATASVFGYLFGDLSRSAVETGHELIGFKESNRTPRFMKNLGPNAKKGLAALLVAGSILAMKGIYTVNPFDNSQNKQEIVQTQNYK